MEFIYFLDAQEAKWSNQHHGHSSTPHWNGD
jgi:hypothetical protein